MTKSLTIPTGFKSAAGGGGGGAVDSVDGRTGTVTLGDKYVDVTGDTMTGPLVVSASVLPLSLATPTLGGAVTGANVLANNDFATDAASWTLGTGWAWLAGGVKHTAGNTAALSQALTGLVAGETYVIAWTMSGRTAGNVVFAIGANVMGGSSTSVNGFSAMVAPGAAATFTVTPSTDFDGSIDSVSLSPVSATTAHLSTDSLIGGTQVRLLGTSVGIGAEATSRTRDTALGSIGIGYQALARNNFGNNNTALGYQALAVVGSGASNTAIGGASMAKYTWGSSNTALGAQTLGNATIGTGNTAVGYQALLASTTAALNTALGYQAGAGVTVGFQNLLAGTSAAQYLTTGFNNTCVGYHAGDTSYAATNALTTGTANTFVGAGTGFNTATNYNSCVAVGDEAKVAGACGVALGRRAVGGADYALALGTTASATGAGSVAIGTSSAGVGATTSTANQIVIGTAAHTVVIPGTFNPTLPASSSFGTSVAIGTNPAATGALRLANAATLTWRNAANSADIAAVTVDAADAVNITASANGYLKSGATSTLRWTATQLILAEGINFSLGSVTGTKFGVNAAQKIGFYGAAPIVQPTGLPAAATDAATTQALANYLRTLALNLGFAAT